MLTSMVEEAVTTGDLVRLLRLEGGRHLDRRDEARGRLAGRRPAALRAPAAHRLGDRGDPPRRPRRDPAARDGVRRRRRAGGARRLGRRRRAARRDRRRARPTPAGSSCQRYPTPGSVPITCGRRGSASSLRRSWLTNTRSASTSGAPASHTWSRSQSWVRSIPGARRERLEQPPLGRA